MADALKAEQIGPNKWRVLAIPFGGEFKGSKDLDREFFSPRTDIKPDWFGKRPVLWHHGQDPVMKDSALGVEDDLEMTDEGWWATVWLERGARYRSAVEKMLAAGKAYGSSGAIGHLVRKDNKTGELLVWPHAEQTLSTMPINFLSRIEPAKAFSGFDDAGISVDDRIKAILADLDALAVDLPPDLPTGGELMDPADYRGQPVSDLSTDGDDEAMARKAIALGRLLNLQRRAESI